MRASAGLLVPAASALLASSLLTGSAGADPRPDDARAHPAADHAYAMPRHDLIDRGSRVRWKYDYAEGAQYYRRGHRPKGLSAKFTVHKPKQVKWRRGDHSLAEIALARPGSNRKRPSYIEVGWVRGNGSKQTRLFVFWWGLKGKPHCYNLRCKGFVRKGHGKRPGAVLKPGTKIELSWIHRHNRWNLYVNGKRSGYYPDRLWRNRFESVAWAQVFGEVSQAGGRGKCTDMGSGKFPKKHRGARVWDIKLHGTSTKANFRKGNETRPHRYRFKRISRKAFRYGGPGAC